MRFLKKSFFHHLKIYCEEVQNGYFSTNTFLFDPKKCLGKKGVHALLRIISICIHTFFERARAKKIIVLALIEPQPFD